MMRKFICSGAILALCSTLAAKELKYPVSSIPPALKENAHTVMRLCQQELEIKSEKLAVLTVTEVRTILNKNGEENGHFEETYDPLNKISNLKGRVYNEQGEQIRKFGFDDIVDHSCISGFSIYDDNRVKEIDPKVMTFPYTVEYSYEIELNQTLFLPSWSHSLENTSYENSSFTVKAPAGYLFRYKEYNLPGGVNKTSLDGKDAYSWSLSNLKARAHEPMSGIGSPNYPLVRLGPDRFEVGESKGSAVSWKELGIWVSSLLENRDQLPEVTKTKLAEITSSCKTDFEKVKKVYEYMQQKTRYVSIQVGIGGWQPFDAATVDRLSYGDCKALSNYTKALLSAVGIKSYYTLVKAGHGSNNIDESFPSSQFNHVILCVPMTKDTLWLECTNQRMPCGYNGDFTDDRTVLLVDGESSRLAHTRAYSARENFTSRTVKVNLVDEESGEAEVDTRYLGLTYDEILPIYYADAVDKQKQVLQRINLPSFSLNKFAYNENRSQTPWFDENLKISFTNYMRKMGDIVLLPVNFMNKLTSLPDKVRNRKNEMCIRRAVLESDTVVYQLPKGFQVTGLPEKSELSGKFGRYSATTVRKENTLTYIRNFELFKGVFPAEAYAEFREFLEQIAACDGAVVSLKKQDGIASNR